MAQLTIITHDNGNDVILKTNRDTVTFHDVPDNLMRKVQFERNPAKVVAVLEEYAVPYEFESEVLEIW